MLLSSVFFLLSLAMKVKSEDISGGKWSDIQNSVIQIPISEYCRNRTCIVKCCPDGRMMSSSESGSICVQLRVNYSAFNKYIQDHSSREVKFVQNEILSDTDKTVTVMNSGVYISKVNINYSLNIINIP